MSKLIQGLIGVSVIAVASSLSGCADSETPGPDGRPRAAGADEVREAARAYATSAPVRRVADYSNAVAQGLIGDPLIESAQRNATLARAKARHMDPPRPLRENERCVGSSIIRIETIKGVPTYTQMLGDGRQPIMCGD